MALIDDIKKLIQLQCLDESIIKLKADMESVPVRIKEWDERFADDQKGLKSAEDEVKAAQVKRKEKEMELQTKEEAIKKLKSQLYQVKTNKEYSAMEKEIGGARADASVLEEEIINYLDKIDELNKKSAEAKKVLDTVKKDIDAEKSKLNMELADIKSRLSGIEKQRVELASGISKNILSKYNRILGNKNGLAIVKIKGAACGGCYMNLPPQVINEVKMGKDIICCENCLRILYTDDN